MVTSSNSTPEYWHGGLPDYRLLNFHELTVAMEQLPRFLGRRYHNVFHFCRHFADKMFSTPQHRVTQPDTKVGFALGRTA